MDWGDLLGDRQRVEEREDALDGESAARPLRGTRAMHSVEKLADGDDADRVWSFPGGVRRGVAALDRDQQAGVDQDGQGDSGNPDSRLIASRSRTKSSSTGGRASISARKS